MKNCINCNKILDDQSEFCSSCGKAQPKTNYTNQSKCTYCGKPVKNFEDKCGYCGAHIELATSSNKNAQQDSSVPEKIDPSEAFAIVSLVCGIVSVVLAWLPFVGFIFSGIGIVFGILGRKSKRKKFAIAGIALSVISLIVNILFIVSCIYIGTLP